MESLEATASPAIRGRYWVLAAVIGILAVSLLLSFDLASGQFNANTWRNLIAGVQVSTLVVVLAFLLWWVRRRAR